MLFVKIDNFWYEYEESTPINDAIVWNAYGGKMSGMDLTGLEIVKAEDYHKLDWRGTELLDDKYLTGWLDKEGEFYGCDYRNHKDQAKFVHNLSEEEIERELFIKLSYEDRMRINVMARVPYLDGKHNEISSKQYQFLKKFPIVNFDEIDYIYRRQLQEKAVKSSEEQSKKKKQGDDSPASGGSEPGL